jgi:hypothetical protein
MPSSRSAKLGADVCAVAAIVLASTYELAWGFLQPGRTFYVKTRVVF